MKLGKGTAEIGMDYKMHIVSLLLLCVVHISHGAKRVKVEKRFAQLRQYYNLPHVKRELAAAPTAEQLLGLHRGEHLATADQAATAHGTRKVKLQETFKGIPVMGETVVVEVDENGEYTGSISGSVMEDIEEDIPSTDPKLSLDEALNIALADSNVDKESVEFHPDNAELEVYSQDQESDNVEPRLVYKLSFIIPDVESVSRPFYIIDAENGFIWRKWEGISPSSKNKIRERINIVNERILKSKEVGGIGGNNITGQYNYAEDYSKLKVYSDGQDCFMENRYVRVIDMKNRSYIANSGPNDTNTHVFDCNEGNNDYINGAYSPINDAFYFSNAVYHMYTQWYGVEPLKFKIVARVHYGQNYENAFWDGQQTTYGDGMSTFYPMTTLDIVGHEIAHGFTEQHSGLIYNHHSGALNEAFSDMSGSAVEVFVNGKTDMMCGGDVMKGSRRALRFLDDPTKDGKSISSAWDYCSGIDVHYSSGVYNRAFYKLSTTKDWDVKTAFGAFVHANRLYWTPTSLFHEGACGVKRAAEDLGLSVSDVVVAFQAVGIEPCVPPPGDIEVLTKLTSNTSQPLNFDFKVDASMDKIQFEIVHYGWGYEEGDLDMYVTVDSGAYNHSSAQMDHSMEIVTISDPSPEIHHVTLDAKRAFRNLNLFAISSEFVVLDNFTAGTDYESNSVTFNFTLPDNIIQNRAKVMVRAYDEVNRRGPVDLRLRFGQPVDLDNYIYDNYGDSVYVPQGGWMSQIILCSSKNGTYFGQMRGREGSTIKVWYATLMTPEFDIIDPESLVI